MPPIVAASAIPAHKNRVLADYAIQKVRRTVDLSGKAFA